MKQDSLTGTVVDSGEGSTHVIPVVDGYVIGSSVKTIPYAGKDVSQFILDLLKERASPCLTRPTRWRGSTEPLLHLQRHCKGVQQAPPATKYCQRLEGKTSGGKDFAIDLGYERFLAPELFFNPDIYTRTGPSRYPR